MAFMKVKKRTEAPLPGVDAVPAPRSDFAGKHRPVLDTAAPSKRPEDIKILHIGNIANNGFMACKLLRERGYQSDLLIYDYYHINSCPEWEQAEMTGDFEDQFFPNWKNVNLNGYKRPRWVAQGPKYIALRYLIAYRQGKRIKAAILWRLMTLFRNIYGKGEDRRDRIFKYYNSPPSRRLRDKLGYDVPQSYRPAFKARFPGEESVREPRFSERIWAAFVKNPLYSRERMTPFTRTETDDETGETKIVELPQPKIKDLEFFDDDGPLWKRLFAEYDLVIGYSLDGMWPLSCGKPYLALEHGTLRNIPFMGGIMGFLTRACYENAEGALITNCDGNVHADRLGLDNYYYVPHPTQEDHYDQHGSARLLRERIEETRDTDFIVFAPARQHWRTWRDDSWDKGNDLLIRGFAKLVKTDAPKALLIMVEAGKTLEESKELIADLGITERVMWIPVQPHRPFIRYMMASDVVCDQFNNGSFGGIPPKAMMCKKPVMTNIEVPMHDWCFPELPPFLYAAETDEIYDQLRKVYLDPEYRQDVGQEGYDWYYKYYSNEVFYQALKRATQSFMPGGI